MDRQTDRQTDKQSDRQTDRQTDVLLTVLTCSCSIVSGMECGLLIQWLTIVLSVMATGTRSFCSAYCSRMILAKRAGDRDTYTAPWQHGITSMCIEHDKDYSAVSVCMCVCVCVCVVCVCVCVCVCDDDDWTS